jgi:thioredoxin reductase
MTLPTRNSLAVIGAGPIGLEAALAGLDQGFDVHVFEQGEVGSHPIAWGHVRMFTPWRMNVGPVSRRHLEAAGWTAPDPGACPTGLELAERYLQPLARLPELAARVHTHAQVVHVGRRDLLRGDRPRDRSRGEHPFRMLVVDPSGRESFIHAFSLIDASGVYAHPNRAGDGGIPARGELYLAPQLSYHLEDVLGLRRARHAGRRTLVIGGGTGAATSVAALAELAREAPATHAVWATRETAEALLAERPGDPFPARRALCGTARDYARGVNPAVTHVGGVVVDGFEFNSATHRYRVSLRSVREGESEARPRLEEVDEVLVNTGYRPDDSICGELQAAGDVPTSAPGAGEPGFHVLGHKSRGGDPEFLLETGYREVAEVIASLARTLEPARG